MGFFDFLFPSDEANKTQPQTTNEQAPTGPTIQKGVESSFPVVSIKHTKAHVNGPRTQVYCQIESTWPEEIMLDKIRIFEVKRELDTILRPRETRDFLVYDGPTLTREYHEVTLDYKTQKGGDYFQTIHTASFSYRPEDKTYTVTSIRLSEAVRDIHEV